MQHCDKGNSRTNNKNKLVYNIKTVYFETSSEIALIPV